MTFEPKDPNFSSRVTESFKRQTVMRTIGARLIRVAPGQVEIELPFNIAFTQQHGFLHAGVVSTIADSACGYAALSLAAPETAVLTVEYKINLLAPAAGDRFIARGRVVRPGKTVTVCTGDVMAVMGVAEKPIAAIQATIMHLNDRADLKD